MTPSAGTQHPPTAIKVSAFGAESSDESLLLTPDGRTGVLVAIFGLFDIAPKHISHLHNNLRIGIRFHWTSGIIQNFYEPLSSLYHFMFVDWEATMRSHETSDGWRSHHFTGEYRAITVNEMVALVEQVGFGNVLVLSPETTGFHQPIIQATW